MLSLELYVILLLAISAVSMFFIFSVLRRQIRLGRIAEPSDNLRYFRNRLLYISLTIIIMGSIPIGINLLTLFIDTGRPPTVPLVSLIYSMGVHLQGLFLSYLMWELYRLAANEREMTEFTERQLQNSDSK